MTGTVRTASDNNGAALAGETPEPAPARTMLRGSEPLRLPELGGDQFVHRHGDVAQARELFNQRLRATFTDDRLREISRLQHEARVAGLAVPVALSEDEQRAVRGAVQELLLQMPRDSLVAKARDSVGRWTQLVADPALAPATSRGPQTAAEGTDDLVTLALSPTGQRMRIAGGAVEAFTGTGLSVSRAGITPVLKGGMTLRSGAATASFGAQQRDGKLTAQLGAATPVPIVASHFRITMDLEAGAGSASLTRAFGRHDGELYATRNADGTTQMGARLVMNMGSSQRRGVSFALLRESGHVDGAPPRTGLTAAYMLTF